MTSTFTNIPSLTWQSPVASAAALPAGGVDGEARVTLDDSSIYIYSTSDSSWHQVSGGGGGSASWGDITGTLSNQTDLQDALDLKAPLDSPTFTGDVIIHDPTLDGIRMGQDIDRGGNVFFEVRDTGKSFILSAGSATGNLILGSSNGQIVVYSQFDYILTKGHFASQMDNVYSIGSGETGQLIVGDRFKDGVFGTSLRAPLFSDINQNSGSAAADVTAKGADNSGAGTGGNFVIKGGTGGGGIGSVQIGEAATTPTHLLNTSLGTPASGILTLTNGPTGISGNPTYIQITVNGTTGFIPFWHA